MPLWFHTPGASAAGGRTSADRGLFGLRHGRTERGLVQRSAIVAFGVRVVSAGLLYLTQIVLARWMGASEFGTYVLAWTWVLVLGGLSHLGLAMATIRLLPEYAETGRHGLARGLRQGGRRVALGVGTLVACAGLLVIHLLGGKLEAGTARAVSLALACVPFYALTDLQDGIGRSRGYMVAALVPPYILRPLVLLLVMIGGHEMGLTMSAVTAAGAAVAATVSAVLIQGWLVRGDAARSRRGAAGLRLPHLARHLGATARPLRGRARDAERRRAAVVDAPARRRGRHVLRCRQDDGAGDVRPLRCRQRGGASLLRLEGARATRLACALAIRDAVRWTFLPSLAAAVAILALGKPLLWLFSPEFTSAWPVMSILVAGYLARASVGPAEFLLNMLGQQAVVAKVAVGAAMLNVALNLLLVPTHGMLGAAVANACALMVAAAAYAYVARRRLGFDIFVLAHLGRSGR